MIKRILIQKQNTILSAALIIAVMMAASRVLGLVRNRVLAHYFEVEVLAAYFAAFRLPEVVFEVLVFGALSSAFIPTFTSYWAQKKNKEAWYVAAVSLNLALVLFLAFGLFILSWSEPIYRIMAPGFSEAQIKIVAHLSRILVATQAFFVLSYFLTGMLESLQRFLLPAIAPLLYNLGIIFGSILLTPSVGIYAPAVGAVVGAFCHFAVQLPLAWHFGFRPKLKLDWRHPGVREVARLAGPRVVELSFLQVGKMAEVFFASLASTAAYTYYTFGNSLQLLPVSLFGASIAKASLPTMANHEAAGKREELAKIFMASFREILFLVLPISLFLAVARIPLTRIAFGAARFAWVSTLQTSYVLSAFTLGIFAQALIYLLARAFYALRETKIPVIASITGIFLGLSLGGVFIIGGHLPIWSLALAYSLSAIVQAGVLLFFLHRRVEEICLKELLGPAVRIGVAAVGAGGIVYVLLKALDRVIFDTRYTVVLVGFTVLLFLVGGGLYWLLAWWLKIEEVAVFTRLVKRLGSFGWFKQGQLQQNEVVGGQRESF